MAHEAPSVSGGNLDEVYYNKFAELAATHIPNNPWLRVGPYDPNNPGHQLSTTSMPAIPTDPEDLLDIFERISPGYQESIVKPVQEQSSVLDGLAERMERHQNTALMTGHEDLMELLLDGFAVAYSLHKTGRIPFDEVQRRSHYALARSTLAYDIDLTKVAPDVAAQLPEDKRHVHMASMLCMLGNFSFVIQKTDRTAALDIDEDIQKVNNTAAMRHLIGAPAGKLANIAVTASSNYLTEESGEPVAHFRPVSPEAASLIARQEAFVAMSTFKAHDGWHVVLGDIVELKSRRDLDAVYRGVEWLARTQQERTGIKTVVDGPVTA